MAVKVSKHAKERAYERLNVTFKSQRNKLFNNALRYGHPPAHFSGEFSDYLENKKKKTKGRGIGVKVYDSNIYIYKNKTIITVFPVPDKYLPVKNNFSSYIKNNPYLSKLYDVIDKDEIVLEVISRDKDLVITGLSISDQFENFGVGETEIKSKDNAIMTYLKKVGKLEECDLNDK